MSNLNKVIFFPIHPTSWSTMFTLALRTKEQGRYEPVMLLTESIAHNLDLCKREGIEAYLFNSNFLAAIGEKQQGIRGPIKKQIFGRNYIYRAVKKIYQLFYKLFRRIDRWTHGHSFSSSLYQLIRFCFAVIYYKNYQRIIISVLEKINPKAVYIYIDNPGDIFALFAVTCLKRKIKIVIPAASFQHPDLVAGTRDKHPYMTINSFGSPLINFLIKKYFPNQFYSYKGKEVLHYMAYEVLAMHLCGILPPYPWVRGKNFCDIICVEDFYQKERLIQLGVEANKIAVTGHIEFDNLWQVKQRHTKMEIYDKYNFQKDKVLIVLALPQLKYHNVVKTWEEHWQEMEFYVQSAVGSKQNVLIVLHPKAHKEDYKFLTQKYNCALHMGQTSEVVLFADIFVAGGSSTIFWAISCGAIVIDFSPLNGYTQESPFAYLKSIVRIYKRAELAQEINRLANEPTVFLSRREQVLDEQKRYCVPLDGHNHHRFLSLIDGEISQESLNTASF